MPRTRRCLRPKLWETRRVRRVRSARPRMRRRRIRQTKGQTRRRPRLDKLCLGQGSGPSGLQEAIDRFKHQKGKNCAICSVYNLSLAYRPTCLLGCWPTTTKFSPSRGWDPTTCLGLFSCQSTREDSPYNRMKFAHNALPTVIWTVVSPRRLWSAWSRIWVSILSFQAPFVRP